jgi:hypothetical protein
MWIRCLLEAFILCQDEFRVIWAQAWSRDAQGALRPHRLSQRQRRRLLLPHQLGAHRCHSVPRPFRRSPGAPPARHISLPYKNASPEEGKYKDRRHSASLLKEIH